MVKKEVNFKVWPDSCIDVSGISTDKCRVPKTYYTEHVDTFKCIQYLSNLNQCFR